MARQGKIARLPAKIRHQLCEQLADGQLGPEILAWVNALPETRAVLDTHFEGIDITANNLSEWRAGGYRDWLRESEREDATRRIAEYMQRLAAASGGNMSAGAVAIATGKLVEQLEAAAGGEAEGIDLTDLIASLSRLRSLELDAAKLDLAERRERTKREELTLAREKFAAQTVEKFLTWAGTREAQAILENGKPRHIQAQLLRELMFGTDEDDG